MNRLRRFAAPFGLAVVALLSRTAVADEIINVSYMCSYGSTIRVADSSGAASNVLFAWPDEVRWDTMFKIIRGDVALIVDTTCSMSGARASNPLYEDTGTHGDNPLFDAEFVRIEHENHDLDGTRPESTFEFFPDHDLYTPKSITFSFVNGADDVLASYRIITPFTQVSDGPDRMLLTESPVTFFADLTNPDAPFGLSIALLDLNPAYAGAPALSLVDTAVTLRAVPAPASLTLVPLAGVLACRRRTR